jgi:hypothetical protein
MNAGYQRQDAGHQECQEKQAKLFFVHRALNKGKKGISKFK